MIISCIQQMCGWYRTVEMAASRKARISLNARFDAWSAIDWLLWPLVEKGETRGSILMASCTCPAQSSIKSTRSQNAPSSPWGCDWQASLSPDCFLQLYWVNNLTMPRASCYWFYIWSSMYKVVPVRTSIPFSASQSAPRRSCIATSNPEGFLWNRVQNNSIDI